VVSGPVLVVGVLHERPGAVVGDVLEEQAAIARELRREGKAE